MVVHLMCGMGNQMFQYAYGRAMQEQGYDVMFNDSWFRNYQPHYGTKHDYQLHKFRTRIEFTDKSYTDMGTMGEWESRVYADQVPTIRHELTLKQSALLDIKTGIHVRRYEPLPYIESLPAEYYQKYINDFGEVSIFSDDIPWCRANLKGHIHYMNLPDYICFELFRNCENKVCSDSTFSWWAAYLGQGNIIWPKTGKYKKGTKYENVKLYDPTN